MNKKPGLLFAVSLLAIIILAASFHMDFGGAAAVKLRAGINPGNVLYVCPVDGGTWSEIARAMSSLSRYIYIFFIFFVIVLMFSWGWALYQNLLKDKFSADAYKNPWSLTKTVFWLGVIVTLAVATPNHFRTVHVRVNGHTTDWVLCENNSPNARAVNERAVTLK